jgi:membrane-bound lytic murein transglycosylase D
MSKRISILIFSFLIGCWNLESKNLVLADNNDLATTSPNVVEVTIDREPFDLWERIRDDLTFTIPEILEDADRYRNRFVNNQHAVNRLSKSGQRYLFHTVKRAEELGVPVELALLPFVESEFDPYAQSLYGATGIWQFLPATGREWGLKTNWWYDGKRDVIASTEAALNFLIYLHRKFDNDWLLAIAAYNAGPGRVNRAIRENKSRGIFNEFT